jgi:uncharacterized protein (DUF2126 family)
MASVTALYPVAMADSTALDDLGDYATGVAVPGLTIHQAAVALDERLDGDPVTRVSLLVDDPSGDTWEVSAIRDLREILGRKATELGLPLVSVTLIPKSEAETVEAFVR